MLEWCSASIVPIKTCFAADNRGAESVSSACKLSMMTRDICSNLSAWKRAFPNRTQLINLHHSISTYLQILRRRKSLHIIYTHSSHQARAPIPQSFSQSHTDFAYDMPSQANFTNQMNSPDHTDIFEAKSYPRMPANWDNNPYAGLDNADNHVVNKSAATDQELSSTPDNVEAAQSTVEVPTKFKASRKRKRKDSEPHEKIGGKRVSRSVNYPPLSQPHSRIASLDAQITREKNRYTMLGKGVRSGCDLLAIFEDKDNTVSFDSLSISRFQAVTQTKIIQDTCCQKTTSFLSALLCQRWQQIIQSLYMAVVFESSLLKE